MYHSASRAKCHAGASPLQRRVRAHSDLRGVSGFDKLALESHGGYHRGNVGQVLKSVSVAPPRDLYTKFLHQSEPARREA